MIDLHSHLLPGIDDGAPDLATALQLAKVALADGITHMVCTPHIHPGRYDNTPHSIEQALAELRAGLAEQQLALQVSAAAEVRFGMELMLAVKQRQIPFLGLWQQRPVLLLEFPHGELPFGAERLTQWLLQQGIQPMIAHPERNKGLLRDPSKIKPLVQQGCLFQVTAGAVAGRFGQPAQDLAERFLAEGLVTILASDAHNLEHRPPVLSEGLAAASVLLGEAEAYKLVQDNPWQLAQSKFAASTATGGAD
ncbi:tyrosine-protein phosphatase [Thiopseudomonas alkaliphila]|uniref:tyrosine-protein phosphatase n=1 Tax=Thiopseudomonas alkaliphila TaxID=1697053 RepID=UPI002574E668|nr:CpsB/CapC family capsule biosynthesis tyrosine phosphatase [Thiopseudomonas alkaliphila]MDM1717145.1 capsular biosynthesis protein [Thiopseudomonas alkaliphila]